jgi:uncharacterized membrane protein YphA (DoxX/SURF4 family)
MDVFSLFIRIFVASIFIGSFYSKVKNIDKHIKIVREYRILREKMIRPFVYLNIIIELAVAIFLYIGVYQTIVTLISIMLIVIYTLAIIINLLKGRKDISCGCGGIIGDYNLSWLLAYRNLLLVILNIILFYNPSNWFLLSDLLNSRGWSSPFLSYEVLLFTIGVLIAFNTLNYLFYLSKKLKFKVIIEQHRKNE